MRCPQFVSHAPTLDRVHRTVAVRPDTPATLDHVTDLDILLRACLGVVSRSQLLSAGLSDADIRRLVRQESLRRIRTGWYAASFADQLVVEAVREGGVLTCLSALRRHGVWVPEHPHALHLRPMVRGNSVRTSRRCRTFGPMPAAVGAVDDVVTALRHAARSLDAEDFIVVSDSALNLKLATFDELSSALSTAPARVRSLLDRCDGQAQSGTETMVRLRLRAKNIGVSTQHHVPGVGHVDLLVGNRLVIEVDSKAHHTGVERYESDRTRDRLLTQLGYLPIRFTYRQVVHDWHACEHTVIDLVRRGDHRRRPHGVRDC